MISTCFWVSLFFFRCAEIRCIECVPPGSYCFTWEMLIFSLEWGKCFLTVWCGSCFTLYWIVRDTCILASWMLFYECMCEAMWVRGWTGGLTMTLRGLLSHSPDQSKYSNAGVSWGPWDLRENSHRQPEEQWWNHNCVHQPSRDVC